MSTPSLSSLSIGDLAYPASSPSQTPSVPDNTPERPLTPQLARRTEPFPDDDAISVDHSALSSAINYDQPQYDDKDDAPVGFIPNDPTSRHYYPIYVPNPLFGKWDEQDRTKVAKYIQYNVDYTYVTGTEGRGYTQRTTPVYIGRRANTRSPMTKAKWEDFKRGSPREFVINEAIADMADPRIIGEVNRLRGKMELRDTLEKMLREARHSVDALSKEYLATERELADTMVRVELANLHALIQDQLNRTFPLPIRIRQSPEQTPLIPRQGGPLEMPVLMDKPFTTRTMRCFRCRKRGHKAQECPQKKRRECRLCGDMKHKKAACPYNRKIEVKVTKEVVVEEEEPRVPVPAGQGTMTLLERIALLDRAEWTPASCVKCGKQDPGHVELECPEYEYCSWCRTSGSYGYLNRHRCGNWADNDVGSDGWDDRDADLYHNDD